MATSGKNKVQGMILQLEEYLTEVHNKVLKMIFKAQQSPQRLDEIVLKLNPLTRPDYLELLIESEKNEAKPGWKQRVEYYEATKRQAEILLKQLKSLLKSRHLKAINGIPDLRSEDLGDFSAIWHDARGIICN